MLSSLSAGQVFHLNQLEILSVAFRAHLVCRIFWEQNKWMFIRANYYWHMNQREIKSKVLLNHTQNNWQDNLIFSVCMSLTASGPLCPITGLFIKTALITVLCGGYWYSARTQPYHTQNRTSWGWAAPSSAKLSLDTNLLPASEPKCFLS